MSNLKNFIQDLPKCELHLHIEGSFEPELMFEIAKRNNKKIKFNSVAEIKAAYNFSNLQDFLDIYYEGAHVLTTEQDFYDLTWAYLEKIKKQSVWHTEIFFDPQTHTDRGLKFETVVNGIHKALQDARQKLQISSRLIMCFLRHLDEDSAQKTLQEALAHQDKISGVGLDSSEVGHPPSKFQNVFQKARAAGFKLVAHAGEEGPSEYVWEAIDLLNVDRIDHGNRSLDDSKLVEKLVADEMTLTVCPLSNLKLAVVKDLTHHPLKTMLQKGLRATVNSDDPAYFGGYVNDNFLAIQEALNLDQQDLYQLARNSFLGSFLSTEEKEHYLKQLDDYLVKNTEQLSA